MFKKHSIAVFITTYLLFTLIICNMQWQSASSFCRSDWTLASLSIHSVVHKRTLLIIFALCLQAPEFPEFTAKVLEAINTLGGRVFPKLNWSAPRVKYGTSFKYSPCTALLVYDKFQLNMAGCYLFGKFINLTFCICSIGKVVALGIYQYR